MRTLFISFLLTLSSDFFHATFAASSASPENSVSPNDRAEFNIGPVILHLHPTQNAVAVIENQMIEFLIENPSSPNKIRSLHLKISEPNSSDQSFDGKDLTIESYFFNEDASSLQIKVSFDEANRPTNRSRVRFELQIEWMNGQTNIYSVDASVILQKKEGGGPSVLTGNPKGKMVIGEPQVQNLSLPGSPSHDSSSASPSLATSADDGASKCGFSSDIRSPTHGWFFGILSLVISLLALRRRRFQES